MPEPQTLIVQSRQNARIKALRASLARPLRLGEAGLVGIEGLHLLDEAMRSGLEVDTVFVRTGAEPLLQGLDLKASTIVAVSEQVLRAAVSTEAPQEVAALVRAPRFSMTDVCGAASPLVLVLAGLQDPGNLGTIVRSTEAFGATGCIALPGTVSPWNAKCVRASAGSVFRLPLVAASAGAAHAALAARGARSVATVVTGGDSTAAFDFQPPCALWIGNEAAGLDPALLEMCEARVTIPCPGPVESLNAAIAASVLLYEASRQRGAR
jgi:TrmH family RNA methyltransferase